MSYKPILYIHAGTFKTGTTSLQNFLSINFLELKKNKILYPKTGRDELDQHHYFFSSIREPQHPYFKPQKTYEEYIKDLSLEISANKPSIVILSSEIFCNLITKEKTSLKFELNLLFNLFNRIKIVFYVRRPDLFGISFNSTQIYFGQQTKHVLTNYSILNWFDVFPKEFFIIRIFEKSQLYDNNLYLDFLYSININYSKSYKFPLKKLNELKHDDYIEICRHVNAFDQLSFNEKLTIKRQIASDFKPTRITYGFFSPEERINHLSKYCEENKFIAKEILGRKDGRLFFDPIPSINDEWKPYTEIPNSLVFSVFGNLLTKQIKDFHNITKKHSLFIEKIEQKMRSL